jgi:hypothetical protein
MTRIEITGVHNIVIHNRDTGHGVAKTISIIGSTGNDVDIVMSAGNTEFLREVLNEDADRRKN